jgi:hypothetical protein
MKHSAGNVKAYLIMPVNFSRTDFCPTHIISTEAVLDITLVTLAMTTDPGSGTGP